MGFGDIVASTTEERVFVLLLMVLATCLFSRLLGDMHDILQLATRDEAALAERMEGVVAFLRANRVPAALQQRIRGWASFRLSRDRADAHLQDIMGMLPEDLRHGVAVSINRSLFSRVGLLRQVHDPLDRAQLAAALLPRLRLVCHPRGAVVASHRSPADRLVVVLEGRLSMNLPQGRYDLQGRQPSLIVLSQGDSIGDASVRAPTPPPKNHG